MPEKFRDHLGLLPKLDSDVVEKFAIWHKHAAADPPSIVEGIAISSMSRPVQVPAPAPSSMPPQKPTAAGPELPEGGVDERVVLERVTRECVQRCIVECNKGCAQWYRALKQLEPCQEACSSPQFYSHDMPCIGACEMAQSRYWLLQRRGHSHSSCRHSVRSDGTRR
ncbi:protein sevenless-like isoform X4 [Drosophila guanche]|uniref:protein sevenless-like isoform X4 n=1 Tax=Drosophila guanche TaxID=7266 RepID=UPI0014711ADA|nr:protein sevenless-like isoform X4 [Drosophila guanche]